MKKILAIALTLTLVFALAVSSSAAALNAKWTGLDCYFSDANVPNMTWDDFEGTANDTIKATVNSDTADWGCAGVKTNMGALANKYTLKFKSDIVSQMGAGDGISIILTEKDTDIVVSKNLGGRVVYNTATNGKGLTITLLRGNETQLEVAVWTGDGAGIYCSGAFVDIAADGLYTVEFTATTLTVNGVSVAAFDAAWADTIAHAEKGFTDADLVFGQVLAGTGTSELELLELNGAAPNLDNAPVPGPADIEVVAIAGAMIVALMAAAFVVKARKA